MNEQKVTLRGVLLKAVALFIALNLLFAVVKPLPSLGKLSLYNSLIPGRLRFPFGEEPDKAYNLSLFSLEAMFASHEISAGPKPADEYRVILLGDSSVWGFLLENEDTLTAQLNENELVSPDGRLIRFYNLGYPTISLSKDLLILDEAIQYEPDLIIWLTTLEAFPFEKQTFTPLVQHNADRLARLIERYDLSIDPNDANLIQPSFWEETIIRQRRALADLLRLQLYGLPWAATGIDQYIPESYEPRAEDLEENTDYYGLKGTDLLRQDIALDILAAGNARAGTVPVLIVNEPMFVSSGENSDVRYNFFYPRWVYDAYRALLAQQAEVNGWHFADLWLAADNSEYTNSAIHLTPQGTLQLAHTLIPVMMDLVRKTAP